MIGSRRSSHRSSTSPRRKSTTSVREDIAKLYNLSDYQRSCQLIDVPPVRYGGHRRPSTFSEEESGGEDSEGIFTCKCYRNLKRKPWWKPFYKTVFFILHFTIVLTVLSIGAMLLADIEDPEPSSSDLVAVPLNQTNRTSHQSEEERFWKDLKVKFDVDIKENDRRHFMEVLSDRVSKLKIQYEEDKRAEYRKDRSFIFWKWVYFVSVACTTIGYGDVVPVTNNGRFFYMIFSLIGIPLMVSMLTACGRIIKSINIRFFRFLNKCCFKDEPVVSESLMTAISILILFVGYVALGCVFNAAINQRPLAESIYYWIVTFTTVGFGDMVQPLEDQVDWVIPLLVYRVFGLAMLAGVIDSLVEYIDTRKEMVRRKKDVIIQASRRLQASFKIEAKRRLGGRIPSSLQEEKQERDVHYSNGRRGRSAPHQAEPENVRRLSITSENSIFSTANDTKRSSFYSVKTFDARVHEPIFGTGQVKVESAKEVASSPEDGYEYETGDSDNNSYI